MSAISQALWNVSASTFEELCFLCPVEANEAGAGSPEPLRRCAVVGFEGVLGGKLEVWASDYLVPVLAGNMLGEFVMPRPEIQQDALKELANVICGNLLPELVGPELVFDMAPPEYRDEVCMKDAIHHPIASAELTFEEGASVIRLFLDRKEGSH